MTTARAGTTITLKTGDILVDERIYPRAKWDPDTVTRYYHALEAGIVLPKILVGHRENRWVLLDGRHRLKAHQRKHATFVEALVTAAKPEEFFAEAVRSNAAHGSPLSAPEILDAIKRLARAGSESLAIAQVVALPVAAVTRILVAATRPPAVLRSAISSVRTTPGRSHAPSMPVDAARIEKLLTDVGEEVARVNPMRVSLVDLNAWIHRVTYLSERLAELRTQKMRQQRAAGAGR